MKEISEELHIYQNIIKDMQEGIFVLDMKGQIILVNPAGCEILQINDRALGTFASLFNDPRNDEFSQIILDSIYEKTMSHNAVVDYFSNSTKKTLFLNTSYLKLDNHNIGVIAVMNDVTELMKLRDAVVAMNQIKALNRQLEVRNAFIKDIFGKYLSDTIVEQIIEQKDGPLVGGEKKALTIMFSDLRGFTAASENMDPQAMIGMLNHYLEEMIRVVSNWNGTILEFMGDGLVIVFGAPIHTPTAEDDAVTCAICMQQAMAGVNAFNKSMGYPELQMGIGLHWGEVFIGNIGSSQKLKYDIIGSNVNLAGRIETYTVGGQILISHNLLEHLKAPVKIAEEKEIWPKGMKEPVKIYHVTGIGEYALQAETDELIPLPTPIDCDVRILQEKTITDRTQTVHIIAVSKRKAIFESNYCFEEYENLTFIYCGKEYYAKVLWHKQNQVQVQATSGDFLQLLGLPLF